MYFMLCQVLSEISQMWDLMEFSYEEHFRTSTPLLKCSDELIEKLEEHQVQTSTMSDQTGLSICLSVILFIHPSIHSSIRLYIHPSTLQQFQLFLTSVLFLKKEK